MKAKGLDGVYKIGRSLDPQRRLQEVQTFSPVPVEIAYTIANKKDASIESALHKHFKHCRLHCEWFCLSEEDIDWIYRNYDLRPYKSKGQAQKTSEILPSPALAPKQRKATVKGKA